jgi:hypothetical protein
MDLQRIDRRRKEPILGPGMMSLLEAVTLRILIGPELITEHMPFELFD